MSPPLYIYTSPANHFVPLRLALGGYSVAWLPRRFALAFSVNSLPCILRFALMKMFKKKCVYIDSKWSKTHRNAKKIFFNPFDSLRSKRRSATFALLGRFAPSGFALATYPMTLPGSQGVSMPNFITIGSRGVQTYIYM